jgi:hypothetical protein
MTYQMVKGHGIEGEFIGKDDFRRRHYHENDEHHNGDRHDCNDHREHDECRYHHRDWHNEQHHDHPDRDYDDRDYHEEDDRGDCHDHPHPYPYDCTQHYYNTRTLISRSWYLSGIVARRLQSVTGDQAKDGLFLLNSLLSWKCVEIDLIPYWTYYEFKADIGRERYFIPNLYAVESLTFNIGPLRYSTNDISRKAYFGTGRIDNVKSLPFDWYFNREKGGGSIYLYFKPESRFPIKIMGKFALHNVCFQTNLLSVYDAAYVEYLRFALAQYMCAEYRITMSADSYKILMSIRRTLMDVSPPDLSTKKKSILTTGYAMNFGDINFGRGFRP